MNMQVAQEFCNNNSILIIIGIISIGNIFIFYLWSKSKGFQIKDWLCLNVINISFSYFLSQAIFSNLSKTIVLFCALFSAIIVLYLFNWLEDFVERAF